MQLAFKALADPTRRAILSQLRKRSLTAGELGELFPISKPSLSHHFNILKSADLVRTERRGQNIVYSLNTSVVDEFIAALLNALGDKGKGKRRK
jgi:DNA-binding transcriptional ArsR family regulator